MQLAVIFTVSAQRPDYLRQSLESWAKVRGVQNVPVLACSEPAEADEFYHEVSAVLPWAETVVNQTQLGCSANTRFAVQRGFNRGADFVICAEEDVEVSDDVLEYFRWAAERSNKDPEMACICAHAGASAATADDSKVVRAPTFNPIVWGTWLNRWRDFIEPEWHRHQKGEGWDNDLVERLKEAKVYSLFPARSRSLHIGVKSTLIPPGRDEWFYGVTRSLCFYPHYDPQHYHEVFFTDLPGQRV